ncbi:hypothetical protein [Streptomyces xanthochromogenes]
MALAVLAAGRGAQEAAQGTRRSLDFVAVWHEQCLAVAIIHYLQYACFWLPFCA